MPCTNIYSLGGKNQMDLSTTWPSEIYHKFTKILDISWIPRVDIFIGLSALIHEECDKQLIYECRLQAYKSVVMNESQFDKSKMIGKSLEKDKMAWKRYNFVIAHCVKRKMQKMSWKRVCQEANEICFQNDPNKGLIHSPDGTNFTRYKAFRNDDVRGRFMIWLKGTEMEFQIDGQCIAIEQKHIDMNGDDDDVIMMNDQQENKEDWNGSPAFDLSSLPKITVNTNNSV
eukprot:517475_1